MLYDRELHFLCETFKKSMVSATIVSSLNDGKNMAEQNFKLLFLERFNSKIKLDELDNNTIYRMSNSFGMQCIIMRLPDTATGSSLVIGPYLTQRYDIKQLLEIAEKSGITPQQLKLIERFCGNSSLLPENSHLFVMLDTFAEHIWGANNFNITDIYDENSGIKNDIQILNLEKDPLINMKLMEERYAAENEMIKAVASGQPHKGIRLLADFENMPFEKRLDDPLRNLKNYSIIMNTLLRKAAESGGVHPLYIDNVSSDFAIKIEQSPSLKNLQNLMNEMYYSYCNLVEKHSFERFSAPVRRAMLTIDGDIESNITLSSLSASQNISPAYLSTLFKRETGKSITEYINQKRMNKAAKLLKTTSLQVQTIASHCGIMDVQYFSKLFKKQFGESPNNYRRNISGNKKPES